MEQAILDRILPLPAEAQALFLRLRAQLLSCTPDAREQLWAGMPSYYRGERFVRLIPFRDHINIEAVAVMRHPGRLDGYKRTPKGMLQLFIGQPVPEDVLSDIFRDTLAD